MYTLKQQIKRQKELIRRWAKFTCHQHDRKWYMVQQGIKENRAWEQFKYEYIISKCCRKEYSIDMLFLHQSKTLLHTK